MLVFDEVELFIVEPVESNRVGESSETVEHLNLYEAYSAFIGTISVAGVSEGSHLDMLEGLEGCFGCQSQDNDLLLLRLYLEGAHEVGGVCEFLWFYSGIVVDLILLVLWVL